MDTVTEGWSSNVHTNEAARASQGRLVSLKRFGWQMVLRASTVGFKISHRLPLHRGVKGGEGGDREEWEGARSAVHLVVSRVDNSSLLKKKDFLN